LCFCFIVGLSYLSTRFILEIKIKDFIAIAAQKKITDNHGIQAKNDLSLIPTGVQKELSMLNKAIL
jgi:hypothetical protein